MRRGRRHPQELHQDETLDFWRVEQVTPDHLLRLRAEMKLPGRGWLQFEAHGQNDGRTELVQTAYFAATVLRGLLYWYGIYPLHSLIFSRMIAAVARRSVEIAGQVDNNQSEFKFDASEHVTISA